MLARSFGLVALALLAPRAAADVLVVGPSPGPGVDFTMIQPAVDAAQDGDVLVILPGNYDLQVLVADRQLVLHGVTGPSGERPVIGGLSLGDLQAGRATVVRGLDIRPFFSGPNALTIEQCAGSVLFEDVVIRDGVATQYEAPRVTDSDRVVFTRCTLKGPPGYGLSHGVGLPAGSGLDVENSSVTLYDSTATGGHGLNAEVGFPLLLPATVGGAGVRVSGGTLFLAGSSAIGGQGGSDDIGLSCSPPADGGDGVVLDGLLRRMDSTLTAGAAGQFSGCAPAASAGSELVVLGGSVTEIPQTLRRLSLGSPVEPGGVVVMDIAGLPSEPVILLQALAPLGQWLGGLKGTLAGAPPYSVFALGALGPGGTAHFEFGLPVGVLPAGMESLLIVDQCVMAAVGGGGVLSAPSTLLLVDEVP